MTFEFTFVTQFSPNMELKKLLLLLVAFTMYSNLHAQMQMGLAHDNVNVTETVRINPAHSVDPIPWIDIKIVGIYAFLGNNTAYMKKDSFNLFKKEFPNELTQNFGREKANGQVESIIYGPAINVSFGKFSIGLNSAFREYTIGRKLPQDITRAIIDGPQIPDYYGVPQDGSNYRVKSLAFGEVGINGGYMVYQMGGTVINVGASVKYLFGVGGLNMLVDNYSYELHDSTDATINNFTGQYSGTDFKFNSGKGIGVDLGVTFEKKVNKNKFTPHDPISKCRYTEYLYRVGFSVLDIGSIKFKNSAARTVNGGNGAWNNYSELNVSSIGDIISKADSLVGNGITESTTTYKAKLPLSFSLQFDYNIGRGLFVNAFALYGAGLKNSFGAERVSMIAITPRYETKRIGVAIPLSVNQFGNTGIGLSIRFWYLSFGVDNFVPVFFDTDVYRIDAYAQLKIPILKSNRCKRKGLGETGWHFKDCSAPGSRQPKGKTKRDYRYH